MLQIRQIQKYDAAKYPRRVYHRRPTPQSLRLLRRGVASAALLLVLEACDWGPRGSISGGIMPVPISESDARAAMAPVFERNGVTLVEDVTVPVEVAGDTVDLTVDGYNDSLQVGYEYVAAADRTEFSYDVFGVLDSLLSDGGPYIKAVEFIEEGQEEWADTLMQEFVDSLRAQGVI